MCLLGSTATTSARQPRACASRNTSAVASQARFDVCWLTSLRESREWSVLSEGKFLEWKHHLIFYREWQCAATDTTKACSRLAPNTTLMMEQHGRIREHQRLQGSPGTGYTVDKTKWKSCRTLGQMSQRWLVSTTWCSVGVKLSRQREKREKQRCREIKGESNPQKHLHIEERIWDQDVNLGNPVPLCRQSLFSVAVIMSREMRSF